MENNGTSVTLPANKLNGVVRPSLDAEKAQENALQEQNKKKELHFKASHGLLVGFFLWIMYAIQTL